jgi:pSer/pThr/pTyr-binding forkhead associated (FHA) protein
MRNTTWTAIVQASRSHYDSVMARGVAESKDIEFPADWPERSFRLGGSRLRVGRRSLSREVAPEIDLTGPPTDPGVSRLHAILVSQPDGSWAVEDPGSENGTIVNGSEIPVGQPVPLTSGDTICIGAWTAITIVASS